MADVSEYKEKCKQLKEFSLAIDNKKIELKHLNEEYEKLENELMAMLEADEMDSFKSEYGTVYRSFFESVSMPQSEQDREAFFTYLRENGLYDSMITVNSQKLNGFYRKESEAAKERGELFFTIPGLGQPKTSPRLGFRKA